MGIQRVPNLLRWTVLACCLPYPGDPKSAIDCFFLFGISLHPGVTGSAPHWKFRGCRVHSFPSPQELLRPASWLALLSRTFTFELALAGSPRASVEYNYVGKQSIPTTGLSPASPTALWAADPDPDSFRPQNQRSRTQNPKQTRPQPPVERGWADKADSRPPLRGPGGWGGDWYVWHAPDGLRARAATGLGCMQAGAEKLGVIEASYAAAIIGVLSPVSSHC